MRVSRWILGAVAGLALAGVAAAQSAPPMGPLWREDRVVVPEPVVYEDFLPRSAAGIFASNLTDQGSMDADQGGADRDLLWMSEMIETTVSVPEDVYADEVASSITQLQQDLS